jgi:hypothetical protein
MLNHYAIIFAVQTFTHIHGAPMPSQAIQASPVLIVASRPAPVNVGAAMGGYVMTCGAPRRLYAGPVIVSQDELGARLNSTQTVKVCK